MVALAPFPGLSLSFPLASNGFRMHPDVGAPCPHTMRAVKQIPCVCGYVVKGEDDDELWQNAQEHMREDHPDLAGKVSRADLLAQAEEVPKPTS
jgi:predicted small metal-binding protein